MVTVTVEKSILVWIVPILTQKLWFLASAAKDALFCSRVKIAESCNFGYRILVVVVAV
jgi:hypothetical protein